MARRMPVADAVSAGGIVWRPGTDGPEVVLCHRIADSLWCLPKGTPDPGETLEQTALREVAEETGLQVRLGELVMVIEYWFARSGTRYHKRVHHWLMEPQGGDIALHDHEFDDVAWVSAFEALDILTYDNEKNVLRRALTLLQTAST